MNDDRHIERLLREAAEHIRITGHVPSRVRRGIRVRRLATAGTSLMIVCGLILGGVVAIRSFENDKDLPPSKPAQEILVTRDALELPDGCGVRDSVEKLLSVTDALKAGDMDALDSSFAQENAFQAIGIGDPHGLTGEDSQDREALMRYLRDRINHDDSYRVMKATVVNQPGPGTYPTEMVQVDFLAMRTADEIDGAIEYRGEAKLDCPSGRFTFVNLFHRPLGESIDTWCPPAPFGTPPGAVVACSQDASDRSLVVFPTQPTLSGMESLIRGRVLQRRRCLVVKPALSDRYYVPLWPRGYSYQLDEDKDIVVLDENGDEVVSEGERVILGGGRLERGPRLSEDVQREVQHCDGPYWVTGTVATPGQSR